MNRSAGIGLEAPVQKQINPITTVLVRGGMDQKTLEYGEGDVEGGVTAINIGCICGNNFRIYRWNYL